jgi:hypothetical protein
LIATIRKYRSDLLLNYKNKIKLPPIEKEPPTDFFGHLEFVVPDVGALMAATFIMTGNYRPENWYIYLFIYYYIIILLYLLIILLYLLFIIYIYYLLLLSFY